MNLHIHREKLPWNRPNAPLAAFVIIAIVGGFAIKGSSDSSTEKLYESQIAACHRGNLLRQESNRRVRAHEIDRDALISFLNTAKKARLLAYKSTQDNFDLNAAESYTKLAAMVQKQVVFEPVSIVDCEKVIPKP